MKRSETHTEGHRELAVDSADSAADWETNLKITDPASVDESKSVLVAGEVKRYYDFCLDSYQEVTRKAEVTIVWLFAIVVGSFGYFFHLVSGQSNVAGQAEIALAVVGILGSALGYWLVSSALKTRDIDAPGNVPENLINDQMLGRPLAMIRLEQTLLMGDRIKNLRTANENMGNVVNRARQGVFLIPFIGFMIWLVSVFLQSRCSD